VLAGRQVITKPMTVIFVSTLKFLLSGVKEVRKDRNKIRNYKTNAIQTDVMAAKSKTYTIYNYEIIYQ
jgi:hypothetical protein